MAADTDVSTEYESSYMKVYGLVNSVGYNCLTNELPRRKRTGYRLEDFLSRRKRRGMRPSKESNRLKALSPTLKTIILVVDSKRQSSEGKWRVVQARATVLGELYSEEGGDGQKNRL